jgi:hypothetical protein
MILVNEQYEQFLKKKRNKMIAILVTFSNILKECFVAFTKISTEQQKIADISGNKIK